MAGKPCPGLSRLCRVESTYRVPLQTYCNGIGRLPCSRGFFLLIEPELSWYGQEVCLGCGYQGTVLKPSLFAFALGAEDGSLLLSCFIAFDPWTSSNYSFTCLSTLTTPGCLGKICIHRQSFPDIKGWRRRCGSISVPPLLPSLVFRASHSLLCDLRIWKQQVFLPSGPTNENRAYDDVWLLTKSSPSNSYFLWNYEWTSTQRLTLLCYFVYQDQAHWGWGLGWQSLGCPVGLDWKDRHPRFTPRHPRWVLNASKPSSAGVSPVELGTKIIWNHAVFSAQKCQIKMSLFLHSVLMAQWWVRWHQGSFELLHCFSSSHSECCRRARHCWSSHRWPLGCFGCW